MSTLATSTDLKSILINHAASQGIPLDLCESLNEVLLVGILMDSRNGVIPGLLIGCNEISLRVYESGKYIDRSSNLNGVFCEARTHRYHLDCVLLPIDDTPLLLCEPKEINSINAMEVYIKTIIAADGLGTTYKVFGKIEPAKEFNFDDSDLIKRSDLLNVIKTACIGQAMRQIRRSAVEAATRD